MIPLHEYKKFDEGVKYKLKFKITQDKCKKHIWKNAELPKEFDGLCTFRICLNCGAGDWNYLPPNEFLSTTYGWKQRTNSNSSINE